MSSPVQTAVVVNLRKTRRRVQFAMCQVGQELRWFQQEHSVRTTGPNSTQDTWSQKGETWIESAAATFVLTRYRKSQLAIRHNGNQNSTMSKCTVEHCHVQCTSVEESWPVSFALFDTFLDVEQFAYYWNRCMNAVSCLFVIAFTWIIWRLA